MASERETYDEINQLHQEIVKRLGPYQFKTKIPRWNPSAPIDQKIEIIQRMLAVVRETANDQSRAVDEALLQRFQRLSPQSWSAVSANSSVEQKVKLIQQAQARLNAQRKAQSEGERKVRALRAQQLAEVRKQPITEPAAERSGNAAEQRLALERAELTAKTIELQLYLDSVDVNGLDRLFVAQKDELSKKIGEYKESLIIVSDLSNINQLTDQLNALEVHCVELNGFVEQAHERLRLDQEEARHARDVQEFQERKARLVHDDQELTRMFGELNRLPKTSDYAINDTLKQLANELDKHHATVKALTFADRAKFELLEKKLVEFRERFVAVNKEIDATHQLLAELKGGAEEILNDLIQLEGGLLITEGLNESIVALQERIKIFLRLLNQNESKNRQILNENLMPFLSDLRVRSREVFQTFQAQESAINERGRQYLASPPKFYMTKGGWVVEKLGDKNRVIGQIVPAASPRSNQYIIKPITAANREAAQHIERYPLTKIIIEELSNEEIIHRQLSPVNNTKMFMHRRDELPSLPKPIVHGYYAFYKDSDVVGFAPSAEKVSTDEERRKLKFYPVGKHKIVDGKLQIQFDPNFNPLSWNITTPRLLETPLFIAPDLRRYGHEDYEKTEFPVVGVPEDKVNKLPIIDYFLCQGGFVVKLVRTKDGREAVEEPIAKWSLTTDGNKIQISAIDDASKKQYKNLSAEEYGYNALQLKSYNPVKGLIGFSDVVSSSAETDLARRQKLPGKYYIYEGGHLVYQEGVGKDEKTILLGKCALEGNKIKFIYNDPPSPITDDIKTKKRAELAVTNAAYADYSKSQHGVPHAILVLLPDSDSEKKKEFDMRLLPESRFDLPEPRPDVELAEVGSSLSVEASDPVSTDKTPGDLYLYSGGIVVEEKKIDGKDEKKVVGRWKLDGDYLNMEIVTDDEGKRLSSLLALSGPQAEKMKVVNRHVVDLSCAPETRFKLNEIKNSNVGYYRFRADGSVWFCPAGVVNEPSQGFFPSNKKRKREWEYDEFELVGHWKLNDQGRPEITYTNTADEIKYPKHAKETDVGYFHLLTNDRLPRPLGHQFTSKDFKAGELAEAADQLKKYSADLDVSEREKALSSDNKAWHISLKRKEYSVFENTYGASHLGRHTIMTREGQTFWHDMKSNTIGIPPGASIDQAMIDKYVELAGHFCKPKLDGSPNPDRMAIRFSDRVGPNTRKAILDAIETAYPHTKGKIVTADDEAHFKKLLSKDNGETQSQPPSPRLSSRQHGS